MQTLREIREILEAAGVRPQRRWGQNFLIDKNLMAKLLAQADLTGTETILEIGPGTGSLTEELLNLGQRVVAVELDRRLCEHLRQRLRERRNLILICGDALGGKHALSPEVVSALGPRGVLVANLPYSVAIPLISQCLIDSWRVCVTGASQLTRFERMTFTVQKELAERLAASPGRSDYGPVSVLTALLGEIRLGASIPSSGFYPRPKVNSRIVRIDFDPQHALQVPNIDTLNALLHLSFNQRRKQIGSIFRKRQSVFDPEALSAALSSANVDPTLRPEQITPEAFAALGRFLWRG